MNPKKKTRQIEKKRGEKTSAMSKGREKIKGEVRER